MQVPDKIPTSNDCYRLMCAMQMPDHIVAHCMQVGRIAVFLTEGLIRQGHPLDRALIQAAALLHDITKARSFKTGENHALSGGRLLSEMGFDAVGHIVRQHVRLDTYAGNGAPDAAQIVNYADKRVVHDRIVSLRQRRQYILQKYAGGPQDQKRIQHLFAATAKLEARIFSQLPLEPEDLLEAIQPDRVPEDLLAYQKLCAGISGRQ